jgi:hypothetical protein
VINVGTPTHRQKLLQAWHKTLFELFCVVVDASDLDMLMDPELDEWFDIRFLSIRLAAAAAYDRDKILSETLKNMP